MKVLVLGDIIEDRYIYGTSTRISPEAPVPVVTFKEEKTTMGGAALVFDNLKSLDVNVNLFEVSTGEIGISPQQTIFGAFKTNKFQALLIREKFSLPSLKKNLSSVILSNILYPSEYKVLTIGKLFFTEALIITS